MSIFQDLGIREGKDRIKEEVLYNIAACYALAERRIEEVLGKYGLSCVKMNALMIIKHVGGQNGIAQNALSKRMIVTAGNITRLVDRLEKENFVERSVQKGDRRIKLIKITRKAFDLLERVWPVYKGKVGEVISGISGRDMERVVAGLNGLRENLSQSPRGKR